MELLRFWSLYPAFVLKIFKVLPNLFNEQFCHRYASLVMAHWGECWAASASSASLHFSSPARAHFSVVGAFRRHREGLGWGYFGSHMFSFCLSVLTEAAVGETDSLFCIVRSSLIFTANAFTGNVFLTLDSVSCCKRISLSCNFMPTGSHWKSSYITFDSFCLTSMKGYLPIFSLPSLSSSFNTSALLQSKEKAALTASVTGCGGYASLQHGYWYTEKNHGLICCFLLVSYQHWYSKGPSIPRKEYRFSLTALPLSIPGTRCFPIL